VIPAADILAWRRDNPWSTDAQVEQDLLLCRCLVTLFSERAIGDSVLFRGGTALHKLHFAPAARYSEDIDLVQREASPIGKLVEAIRDAMSPLLGRPQWKQTDSGSTFSYRTASERPPSVPIRVKIEINTREHFQLLKTQSFYFKVDSAWFRGSCEIATYHLSELLGTKMRALYQRRKGRDLFDLWTGLTKGDAEPGDIVECFRKYIKTQGVSVTRKNFEKNLAEKMKSSPFLSDMDVLLRPGVRYDAVEAYELVLEKLISLI
jgi:predicted nucleotidyltransferase component of viral defense system